MDILNVTRQKCVDFSSIFIFSKILNEKSYHDCVLGSKKFSKETHCCWALLIVDMQWII